MSVNIPIIKDDTIESVKNYFIELYKIDLLYHQDDSAFDCFDDEELAYELSLQQKEAWRICKENNVDIHELYAHLAIGE